MDPQGQATSGSSDDAAKRAADIQKAVELGQKRAAEEAERKANIAGRKEDEAERSEESVKQGIADRDASRESKKEFLTVRRKREQEVIEDKERREKQNELILAEQKSRTEKRKQEQVYMGELHENARIKQAEELRQNTLKAHAQNQRKRAENDHRKALEDAARAYQQRKDETEREAVQRKTIIDTELRGRLYQADGAHRAKTTTMDSDLRRETNPAPGTGMAEAARKKSSVEAAFRVKRRKMEGDYKEEKEELLRQSHQKCTDIDNACRARVNQAEAELKQAQKQADRDLARTLEDIARDLDEGLHGSKD